MNHNSAQKEISTEQEILEVKRFRTELAKVIEGLKDKRFFEKTRSLSIVRTKLEEARMWAGKHLAEIGDQTPYIKGNDVTTHELEPTPDMPDTEPPSNPQLTEEEILKAMLRKFINN